MNSTVSNVVWMFITHIIVTYSQWITSDTPFPYSNSEMAIGEYNGTIFILGGYDFKKQLTTYEIATDTLTDHGSNVLSDGVDGTGQYWTQIDDIIYMIYGYNPQFNIFTMITQEYTTNWNSIVIPKAVRYNGCLTSSDEYLFIIGGRDGSVTHNILQILSLTTQQWVSNPPSMQQPRRSHACIVHNQYLWVFGGSDSTLLSNNERISTTNIIGNEWNYIDPLTVALYSLRSSSLFDIIYIIGGVQTAASYDFVNIVHLVDANTGNVSVSSDLLPLINAYGSPIIVDAVLYAFGGFYDSGLTTDWAHYSLPTNDPTKYPSKYPSQVPTGDPTKHPSYSPTTMTFDPTNFPTNVPTFAPTKQTVSPSDDPTVDPTLNPTTFPTIEPTLIPTYNPTNFPTNDPTSVPTYHPTQIPTFDPIEIPTKFPTFDPTFDPTNNPTIEPTIDPTNDPTFDPTNNPTIDPTNDPTNDPTIDPTIYPTINGISDTTSIPIKEATFINITLITQINGSITTEDVVNTITNYLIATDIGVPLSTDIIQTETSLLIIFSFSNDIYSQEINSEEIQDVLNDDYDGKVKVKNININNNSDNNQNDDDFVSDNHLSLSVYAIIFTLICGLCIAGIIIFCYKKAHVQERKCVKTIQMMETNINTEDEKPTDVPTKKQVQDLDMKPVQELPQAVTNSTAKEVGETYHENISESDASSSKSSLLYDNPTVDDVTPGNTKS